MDILSANEYNFKLVKIKTEPEWVKIFKIETFSQVGLVW